MAMLEESLRLRVIPRGARNYRAYAELAAGYEERVWESNGTRNRVQRMPSGPAVVITPWNAPFMLSTWKTAPALAAGCTVVLKPAEWSPLSCSLLADLVAEADLPPGVFNLVQGIGEEVGAALVADPRVRRVSFTGSPETARHIGVAAARNLVPFTAELGGKSPLIVFADADIEAAAKKAAGQYDDGGQVCLAGTRLLVERVDPRAVPRGLQPLHRRARARRLARSGHHRQPADPPRSPRPRRGLRRARARGGRPHPARRQAPHARRAVVRADADRAGEQRLRGRAARGLRAGADAADVQPTRPTRSGSPTAREYGLAAQIWTGSEERAERVGRALRAGTVWVNCFLIRDLTAPFGGIGISGIGREGGDYALDFYSDLKTLQILDGSTR